MVCQTAVVYERNVAGQLLSFGHSGRLVDRALGMDDPESGSLWNQATGIAVEGPLEGQQLRALPVTTTTLDAWFDAYPDSGVLVPLTEASHRERTRIWGEDDAQGMFLMVRLGERLRAYPLASFPADGVLHDQLGEEPIACVFGRRPRVLAAWSRRVGEDIVELEARAGSAGLELAERGGTRRWSAISGRPDPPRSAPPLRPLTAFPIDRLGVDRNFAAVELFGSPPPAEERDRERAPARKRGRKRAPTEVAPTNLLAAAELRRTGLGDDEAVLGIALGGAARAYPLARLVEDAVLNDTIGGVAIAATFGAECQAAVAYERTLAGQPMLLSDLGVTVDGASILYDMGTSSRWNQATGISIGGKNTGRRLPIVPACTTTLGAWLAAHPDSRVIAPPAVGVEPPPRARFLDPRDEESMVLLVRVGKHSRAYPLARFPESGLLHDQLGEEPIALLCSRQLQLLCAWSRQVDHEGVEFEPLLIPNGVELVERGGTRRWNGLSGSAQPPSSAPPLRLLPSLPLHRSALDRHFPATELFGGPLPPAGAPAPTPEKEGPGRR
ncbi:MAG: DUF3179 domain-containing protein [Planctomycetes bacterium]|nr:DUF3179 domain-containing protein [Planctomycetota bacterium]